jgi:hypothetical protein
MLDIDFITMNDKKSWQAPNLMKYGTVEQLTELSSSEIQQFHRLVMNGAGAMGLFASFNAM